MKQKSKVNHLPNKNPVRDMLNENHAADFSSAALRRLALFQQGRIR